jgi:hypothetical protein
VNVADRFRLLFSPYRTPRFRVGQRVCCAVRGEVVIVGLSEAPIPWPLCKVGKWHRPVVYKGLARAVRRESEQAVAHHWGVGHCPAWQWRKALGVGATTEGTRRLRRDHFAEPWAEETRQKGWGQGPRSRAPRQDRGRQAGQAEAAPRHRGTESGQPGTAVESGNPPQDERSPQTTRDAPPDGRKTVDGRGGSTGANATGRGGGPADGTNGFRREVPAARAGRTGRKAA